MTLPAGPFSIILADPPWRFTSNSEAKPGRNARRHYPCMTDAEIAALPVRDVAAGDALVLMWTTAPMLARSMPIMSAWGFRYVSQLVWVKHAIGTGFWARNRHEIVLIGKRGRFACPRPAPFGDSVIVADRREHSRKPDSLHAMVESVLAWRDLPKVELFARAPRAGWTAWGNETDRFADREAA
jgi:N6-adenosine-specific RNA methylase IME4